MKASQNLSRHFVTYTGDTKMEYLTVFEPLYVDTNIEYTMDPRLVSYHPMLAIHSQYTCGCFCSSYTEYHEEPIYFNDISEEYKQTTNVQHINIAKNCELKCETEAQNQNWNNIEPRRDKYMEDNLELHITNLIPLELSEKEIEVLDSELSFGILDTRLNQCATRKRRRCSTEHVGYSCNKRVRFDECSSDILERSCERDTDQLLLEYSNTTFVNTYSDFSPQRDCRGS